MHCPNKLNDSCKLINQLLGRTIDIPQAACIKCSASNKPQQLNRVIYGIAQFHETDPDRKRKLIALITPEVTKGPGTELRKILTTIGIHELVDCECDSYANRMDLWGTQGCIERIHAIEWHLNSQKVSWFNMLKVIRGGYLTTRSLIETAISRSK